MHTLPLLLSHHLGVKMCHIPLGIQHHGLLTASNAEVPGELYANDPSDK